jgi:hypothetical protein
MNLVYLFDPVSKTSVRYTSGANGRDLAIMFHVVLCWFCWSVMDWETPREADWD